MTRRVESLVLETAQGGLTARVHGPEDGRPALALHGWLDNAATWDRFAPLLDGVRFVSLDLPGHGRSYHRPPGAQYHFVDWLPVVDDALRALGWHERPIDLFGHSMGGGISSLYAGVASDRIRRLVLVEGLGPLTSEADVVVDRVRDALKARAKLRATTARVYPDVAAAAARLQKTNGYLSTEAATSLVEWGTENVEGGRAFRHDPMLRLPSPLRFTEAHVLAFLSKIEAPTMLFVGESGASFPRDVMERRVAAVPAVEVVRVPGHHHLHLDTPEVMIDHVRRFLG